MRLALGWPKRIGSQIALLLVAAIIVFHLSLAMLLWATAPRVGLRFPPEIVAVATAVQLIDAAPAQARPAMIGAINTKGGLYTIALGQPVLAPAQEVNGASPPQQRTLRGMLGPGFEVVALEPGVPYPPGPGPQFAITLRDGGVVTVTAGGFGGPPMRPWSGAVIATLIFLAINLVFLSVWAWRLLVQPLRRFADAAESFSIAGDRPPLPERGPLEIRSAAGALNKMQERIRAMVTERTRMLAAVSHDLRTPITRLRLRLEFIAEQDVREAMERDLTQMDAMVHAALSYLREGRSPARTQVDISNLLETVADQFADMGHTVGFDGPGQVVAVADPDALHRAVTNLVQNAVRFADHTRVDLEADGARVTIAVVDDGPGIAADEVERLMEPFARGDEARSQDEPTGFGLGLPIAKAIAESHGGTLTLLARRPRGLEARLMIPQC